MEEKKAKELISAFIREKNNLNYANLTDDNQYLGWVADFNINYNDQKMYLNLKEENDLFLLFVLALVWSRSGQWENAAYFVTYLKANNKDYHEYWLNNENIKHEIKNRDKNAAEIINKVYNPDTRNKISFRKDIFDSIHILAVNWSEIKNELENSSLNEDYVSFMNYLRGINGLGVKSNRIYIKIPLILRELRCQNIYDNIPGDLCCVPDERVKKACSALDIKIPSMHKRDINSLIRVSTKIYNLFGDLYDLPLFAYEDIDNYK